MAYLTSIDHVLSGYTPYRCMHAGTYTHARANTHTHTHYQNDENEKACVIKQLNSIPREDVKTEYTSTHVVPYHKLRQVSKRTE